MVNNSKITKAGLEGVVANSSSICYLDGQRGVLAYHGYDIHDLARASSFEETCYLLWHGRLPTRRELGDLESQLAASRPLPEPILRLMRTMPTVNGMDAIRTLTSALAHYDTESDDVSFRASYRKAVRLTGQLCSLVATWGRMSGGGGPIQPDPAMKHAANFLYMLTGERPSSSSARALDVALILHADNELNASTFAARVTAATLADIHSTVVSAIGALKGPLHGGANTDVMRLLERLGQILMRNASNISFRQSLRGRKKSQVSVIACTALRIHVLLTFGIFHAISVINSVTPVGFRCLGRLRR